jgi:GTP-binding protein
MSYQKTLVVSIVGRPNVGKSTVFNRFIHSKRKAMTHDFAGVTRDGHYAPVTFESSEHLELPEVNFILVDTGGFYPEMENKNLVELSDEDIIWAKVAGHSKVAIEESDFCLLTMDIRGGLTGADEEIVRFLRLKNKPFWILLNKCDHEGIEQYSADFARLGIDQEEMFLVSAEHALGFDELTNCLHALLNEFL